MHSSWTGAIFAQAGVERLGLLGFDFKPLTWMIPAPAQGAIGIASLDSNTSIQPYLKQINSTDTALCTEIERTFLNTLEGGCTAPIGANAKIEGTKLIFNQDFFPLMENKLK